MKSFLSISQEEVLLDMVDYSIDDCMAIGALYSAPSALVVSYLKEEIVVEEYSSFFLQKVSHDVFSPGIEEKNHDIDSDVDMKNFQDHTIDPFPLYIKEKHCVEINHPRLAEDTKQYVKVKHPSMDIHEENSFSQLTYVIGEDKGEMEEIMCSLSLVMNL
jgi:hypothetical protein